MQKHRVIKLKETAKIIAENFSNKNREYNYNNETFEVSSIMPLSESTGLVYLIKNTGKYCLAFCYWTNGNGGLWNYFIPTYDHCVGMERVKQELFNIEQRNFNLNTDEEIKQSKEKEAVSLLK